MTSFEYELYYITGIMNKCKNPNIKVAEPDLTDPDSQAANDKFRDGLVSSFTMILLAEIADKTFFIAAIMAMRYSKLVVFLG